VTDTLKEISCYTSFPTHEVVSPRKLFWLSFSDGLQRVRPCLLLRRQRLFAWHDVKTDHDDPCDGEDGKGLQRLLQQLLRMRLKDSVAAEMHDDQSVHCCEGRLMGRKKRKLQENLTWNLPLHFLQGMKRKMMEFVS